MKEEKVGSEKEREDWLKRKGWREGGTGDEKGLAC